MSFLSNIYDAVKRKQAEIRERREFLDMVESQAKPIRRKAYLAQTLKEVVKEGIEKAKLDATKKIPQKQKTASDFGIAEGLQDPYRFLDPEKSKRDKAKRDREKSKKEQLNNRGQK